MSNIQNNAFLILFIVATKHALDLECARQDLVTYLLIYCFIGLWIIIFYFFPDFWITQYTCLLETELIRTFKLWFWLNKNLSIQWSESHFLTNAVNNLILEMKMEKCLPHALISILRSLQKSLLIISIEKIAFYKCLIYTLLYIRSFFILLFYYIFVSTMIWIVLYENPWPWKSKFKTNIYQNFI